MLNKPGFSGILAYSLAEAIDLVRDGISDDILVAYPSTDRAAFAALAADETLRRAITIMIDSPDHLGFLPTGTKGNAPFRICLDVDASWKPLPGIHIGTRRSPIYRPRHAARVAKQVRARPDTALVGIMMYEGHIAGVPDSSRAIKLMKRRALAQRRARVVKAVIAGGQLEFVNGGGTGFTGFAGMVRSFRIISADGVLHDCHAGAPGTAGELFRLARLGLGAFGVITEVELDIVDKFCLYAQHSSKSFQHIATEFPERAQRYARTGGALSQTAH